MIKQLFIKYKNKKIKVLVKQCNLFEKGIGLMFSRREKAGILLFEFKKKQIIAIHSFFVFYPFLAIWLDETNKILQSQIVMPFNPCISSKKPCFKMIEIPINSKNKKILSLLDEN